MDNEIHIDRLPSSSLKGKVIVLTAGGASGMGAAAVRLFKSNDAHVVFGDLDAKRAEAVVSSLGSDTTDVTFVPTNVTSYADNVDLFKTAHRMYGRVDHAVSFAGISEVGQFFDRSATLADIEKEPDTITLDVNLKGALYFARVAMAYLKDGKHGIDRSLTVFSSVAGFKATPGLEVAKHGVLGLMRIFKTESHLNDGVRVNAICPGLTDTNMAKDFVQIFRANGHVVQTAEDVALLVSTVLRDQNLKGKAILVTEGRAWDFEDGLDGAVDQWLGEVPSAMLRAIDEGFAASANPVNKAK